MTITAEVICDSTAPTAPHRLTTFRVKCPAWIVQQLARHRTISMPDFSLSVSSMRAIPLARQIQAVIDDPAMPIEWGHNKPGMRSGDKLADWESYQCQQWWFDSAAVAVEKAKNMGEWGLHKEVASRILVPFSHYEMVLTSCAPALINFFALRIKPHADAEVAAQPEMRRLAVRMADAYRKSTPRELEPGWWHLPYVTDDELDILGNARAVDPTGFDLYREEIKLCLAYSVARCARVSYLRHGSQFSEPDKDLASHDRFLEEGAWSTFEHQCQIPMPGEDIRGLEGNLPGVKQYRQMLKPNVYSDFDFSILDQFSHDLKD